ncbi:ECF transporter S component [Curtobacterium herbarum]|uniref:ECF transporter S component n=1 Tax=Curtobacterium herbarum TaxID=150122 RepID=A0ABN1ZA44_9MICO|nr:ECF transporter S component [Curtobacterium herbarum]MBM7476131.1 energy-coupling factor transport system substrate-specific component [Curtobacterium herbarum]MCS6544301.1 ECF transporter S component [Curtobacterium herbarum]
MSTGAPTGSSIERPVSKRSLRWRVIDIVVAAVLAVAVGVVFKLWDVAYEPIGAGLGLLLPGSQALVGGVWLLAGPLVAIVVRKPGAALFGEIVAASVEAMLGTQWGWGTLLSGLVQGIGAEIVLALFLYRVWKLPVVMLAGAATGLALGLNDAFRYYAGATAAFQATYVICAIVSGVVISGIGSWLLVRALARTGVLSSFAAGREHGRRPRASVA